MDVQMKAFLEEANLEKQSRDRTLKSGVVHEIHLAEDVFEAGKFISLSDTPASYADQAKKFLIVNDGKTALLFKLIDASDVQPGTFPSGSYVFQGVVTGVAPTLPNHLATKEYVDDSIGMVIDYEFNNIPADIDLESETTYVMADVVYAGTESLSRASITSAAGQLLFCFATLSGEPGGLNLPHGTYDSHMHLAITGGGARTVDVYWTLSSIDADGTNEVLLMTSETHEGVSGSETEHTSHAVLGSDITLGSSSRLLWKLYGNGNAGSDATMLFYLEGDTGTHLTIKVPSTIFNRIYVRQDGTTPLTGNWAVGSKAISGISLLTLDIGAGINEFSTDGTLGGNSDTALVTEKAVKTALSAIGGVSFKTASILGTL